MANYPEDGLKGSTVIIVAIVLTAALLFLKFSPDLPIDVDVGGAASLAKNEVPYTEKALLGDFLGTCEDSDGGLNERVKGIVNANGESAEDECNSDKSLVEYYCENKQLKFNFIPCPEYCREGKCVSKPKVKEYFKISEKSDGLEIDEDLGDVIKVVSSIELDALRGSSITTADGRTKVNQYIRFKDGGLDSGSVTFKKDEKGSADDYLYFEENEEMFEYEIEFEEGLRSKIVNGVLTALEDEKIFLLGRSYQIATASVSDGTAKIAFMSGAIQDGLNEGETKKYQLEGVDYEIKAVLISDANPSKVTLKINDEETKELGDGELFFTKNGVAIGIEDILNSEAGEGSDSVRIFIGAEEIEFQDGYGDTSFSNGVSWNKEIIDAGSVSIRGQKSGDEFEFSSLKYRLKADAAEGSGVYVKKKHGLKEFIQEPEGIFGGWDIVYGGLAGSSGSSTTVIDIKPRGDDEYNLMFVNRRGSVYNIPFVSNRGSFKLGSNNYDLIFRESGSSSSYFVDKNDLFIVNSDDDVNGFSSVLRYNGIDVSNKVVHFDDVASGGKSAVYTGELGVNAEGSLVVGGFEFKFFIGPDPYPLSIDLDHSGSVDSGEAKIVLASGAILDLGSTNTPGGSFDITHTVLSRSRDEPGKGDEVVTINILATSGVDLNVPSQSSLSMNSVDGERIDMTPVGVLVRQITSDDADRLQIGSGRGGQMLADVAIVIIEEEKPITNVVKSPTAFAVFYELFED